MVNPANDFFIRVSVVIIFCTLFCWAECEKCHGKGEWKPLSDDACSSCSSYLCLDFGTGQLKTALLNHNVGCRSELFCLRSTYDGFQSESQCLKAGNLDINRSDSGAALPKLPVRSDSNVCWSADDVVFCLPDGGSVCCSLNFREFVHEKVPPSVNGTDQIVLSSCRGHLLNKKETRFSLQNIDIEKYTSSDSSSPRVSISPSKLNWGRKYLYHLSVASLSLKNTCNESVLKVYEPLSTDSQFYPFNFSEVVLGPGEVTSISFAYLPNRLGLSSAELILLTSLGGFLVQVKGSSVESPYRLRPLVGLDALPGEWLSRILSLSNPFNETINLEEVTALISIFESAGSLLAESICRKQNPKDFNKHNFSKVSNGDSEHLDSIIIAVRPLNNWSIRPHRFQSILEMAFSPDSEWKAVGSICMEVFGLLKDEKDVIVVPFEAGLNRTATWKDTSASLSVSIVPVGSCDASETTISVLLRNKESHLLKIVKINEVVDSKKLLQIKYLEGLLLFPGTVSQVALVTFDSSNVEMPDVSSGCKLEILVNGSVSRLLKVPCLEIFAICPRQQRESFSYTSDVDHRSKIGSPTSIEETPVLTEVLNAEADDFFREGRRAQRNMNRFHLLDSQELLFPLVPIGKFHAKSIIVRNPSQKPVSVQLILNSGEIVENCKPFYGHQQFPSPSSSLYDSTRATMCGFSVADSTVTEAFLHPNDTASLGPILFHPSNRCEWKSSALIRNNLSGLEMLSLRGFGGSFSLAMLEGSDFVQRLEFNMNFSLNTSNNEDETSCCHKPLLKKLFAVNSGDFPVVVKRIDVSGRECGLDGFVVLNCRGFSLEPGESLELGLSYQSDFSVPVVRRELELILAVGILVIPMQASMSPNSFNPCRISNDWARVKGCCLAIILITISLSLLFWFTMLSDSMDCLIKEEKSSFPVITPKDKSSAVLNQGNRKAIKPKTGHMKQGFIAEYSDRAEITPSSEHSVRSVENVGKVEAPQSLMVKTRKEKKRRSKKKTALIEVSSSQSGNSTPSSPLSPVTTLCPETCSLSLKKMQPHDSFSPETFASARVRKTHNQNVFSTQQGSLGGSRKMGSQAMLMPSATFPGSRSSPSRLAMEPYSRAPGPKIHRPKVDQAEENVRAEEDRFTYDIWGNHFSGFHLCLPNSAIIITSGTSGAVGHSDSFFFRNPKQTLMTNSQPPSVSSFSDEG